LARIMSNQRAVMVVCIYTHVVLEEAGLWLAQMLATVHVRPYKGMITDKERFLTGLCYIV
jgi:hypothetical protein